MRHVHGVVPCVVAGLFCFVLCVATARAQSFTVKMTWNRTARATVHLTIYDGDSTSRQLRSTGRNTFSFGGSLRKPALASITSSQMARPLYFMLENSVITIDLDCDSPQSARIVGSRSNSQFRYALEPCGEADADCLAQVVRDNPTAVFAPFLLYEHLSALPLDSRSQLFDLLDGDARHTYHYHLLEKTMRQARAVDEGRTMPDFVFVDENGSTVHFDSVRSTASCNVILVSATWCSNCREAEQELLEMQPQVLVHTLLIDKQPRQWEAPCLTTLAIDHLPYLILIDAHGKITARDLRSWELARRLDEGDCAD